MTTRRNARTRGDNDEPLVPGSTDEPVQLLDPNDDIDVQVQGVIEELGGDENTEARAQIGKFNAKTEQFEYLPSMPAKQFSIDALCREYGGGKYQVRVYAGRRYIWGRTIAIAESVKPSDRTVAPLALPNAGGTDQATLAGVLNKLIERLDKPAPKADAMEQGFGFAKQIVDLAKGLSGTGGGGGGFDIDKELSRAEKLADLATKLGGGGGARGGDDDSDTVKVFRMAKEMGVPLLQVMQQAIELKRTELARGNGAPAAAVIAPAATPAAPAPAPEGNDNMEPWVRELMTFIPTVVNDAKNDGPAMSCAAFVLDRMSDITFAKMVEWAAKPDAAQTLVAFVPALQPYPDWVQEFIANVQQIGKEAAQHDQAPQ